MIDLTLSDAWRTTYPDASVGILAMKDVANPQHHAELEARKAALEDDLRARYAGYDRAAFKALPSIQAYNAYYRRFKKSYHVQLQLESVVLKGKSIPSVAALVETMFMAELNNQLLTAGHDLALVQGAPRVDVAGGSETYLRINGQEQTLKAGDMYIADAHPDGSWGGILSSILYGPDRRTRITDGTTEVLFTVYAPSGIEPPTVRLHLQEIESYVQLVAPQAQTTLRQVFTAQGPR
jgi:DNA/RNA-binding domain of Phe-tRNA-synthetase-like protein